MTKTVIMVLNPLSISSAQYTENFGLLHQTTYKTEDVGSVGWKNEVLNEEKRRKIMECDALDLHRNFIENQKQQIELANNLIEHANGNEEVIRMANELIKSCEKSISIEQNMDNFIHCPE